MPLDSDSHLTSSFKSLSTASDVSFPQNGWPWQKSLHPYPNIPSFISNSFINCPSSSPLRIHTFDKYLVNPTPFIADPHFDSTNIVNSTSFIAIYPMFTFTSYPILVHTSQNKTTYDSKVAFIYPRSVQNTKIILKLVFSRIHPKCSRCPSGFVYKILGSSIQVQSILVRKCWSCCHTRRMTLALFLLEHLNHSAVSMDC